MTYDQLIEHYGTASKAAKKLGLTENAIYQWKCRKKIPWSSQAVIQIRSKGRLRADEPQKEKA